VQAHPNIAEVAVVGVADPVKGQMPLAFAVVKDAAKIATPELRAAHEKEVMAKVDAQLGAIARPGRVHFVSMLPKTRSGKLLGAASRRWRKGATPATSPRSRTRARWNRCAPRSGCATAPGWRRRRACRYW
jgi:propionyl-CoA synthetase